MPFTTVIKKFFIDQFIMKLNYVNVEICKYREQTHHLSLLISVVIHINKTYIQLTIVHSLIKV